MHFALCPADHAEDVAGRRLLLQRLGHLRMGSGEGAVLFLELGEQPHVLDGDHRLVGKGFDELNLLIGERLNFKLVEDNDAEDVISPEHGHAKFRADGIDVSLRVAVLGIRLEVGNMDRPSLQCDSRRDAVSPRGYGVAPDEIDQLRGGVVKGHPVIGVAVPSEDDSAPCIAQPRRVLDEGV